MSIRCVAYHLVREYRELKPSYEPRVSVQLGGSITIHGVRHERVCQVPDLHEKVGQYLKCGKIYEIVCDRENFIMSTDTVSKLGKLSCHHITVVNDGCVHVQLILHICTDVYV